VKNATLYKGRTAHATGKPPGRDVPSAPTLCSTALLFLAKIKNFSLTKKQWLSLDPVLAEVRSWLAVGAARGKEKKPGRPLLAAPGFVSDEAAFQ
jgi:hypothetical protein